MISMSAGDKEKEEREDRDTVSQSVSQPASQSDSAFGTESDEQVDKYLARRLQFPFLPFSMLVNISTPLPLIRFCQSVCLPD